MAATTRLPLTILVAMFVLAADADAQVNITKMSGGTVRTELGYGITVNKGSSLEREWITVHHETMPARLVGTIGIRTVYKPDRLRGEYNYTAEFTIEAKESLTAVRVHFLLFDVWGKHVRTLGSTDVVDLEPGQHTFKPSWRAWSENDVSEFYASIAYLARVRTKAGRIVAADTTPVVAEAQKFATKFSAEDLEPAPEKR